MTYDDLVTRLQGALTGPGRDATAAQLRRRFEVVLVDEFQDTDPAQWEIMHRAFAGDDTTLVLIADPKQAIYAFRGADVYAYLEAAAAADARATLQTNWRSDQGLIDAHDALFAGARLGHPGIAYRHVRAAAGHRASTQVTAAVLLYRAVTYLPPIPLGAIAYLIWRHAPALIRSSPRNADADSSLSMDAHASTSGLT